MKQFNILIFATFLSLSLFCCTDKTQKGGDKEEIKEYYELCLGANEYTVSYEVLKNSDCSESARYFAELIGHRFVEMQVTVLNKDRSVDTAYTLFSNNGHKVKFKPLKSDGNHLTISNKKIFAQQAYLGTNLLDENPISNIILVQNASMFKQTHKIILTAAYFKIPASDGGDIFKKLEPKYCDTSSISFVHRLQSNRNIFEDEFKQTILKHLQ